jgi:hypothetical protein
LEPLPHPTQAQRSDFGAEVVWFGALPASSTDFFGLAPPVLSVLSHLGNCTFDSDIVKSLLIDLAAD